MINHKLRHLPLAAAALVACAGAHAGYQSPDGNFSLSGFGTLGAAKTTTDDVIMNYPGQRGGATKDVSLNPDSKLAVQGTYKFTPTLSATTQVMTKFDGDGQYEPKIEWIFGKWQATPGLSIRAGRMGAPYFMISDFRDVGYANLAVRPQLEVYGQVPVSQFEGADISYQLNLGDTTITSSLWAGDSHTKYTSALNKTSSVLDVKKTRGITVNADLGNGITLRGGHTRGEINVKNDGGTLLKAGVAGLQTALTPHLASPTASAASATLNTVYALVNPDNDKATFNGIGMTYDVDNWVFNTEFTKRKTKGFVADTTGMYAQLGYRVNSFTPYIGIAKIKSDRRSSNPVHATALPGGLGAFDTSFTTIRQGVQQTLNTQKFDQKTFTLGSRWDYSSNLALKFQWDRTSKPADAGGMFLAKSSDAELSTTSFTATKKTVHVFTLSADFIF